MTTAVPIKRLLDIQLDAERLSLPEIGRYFRPLATINLEPKVNVKARGTLDALNMDVDVVSSAGTARGPLVGHFNGSSKNLGGRLDVREVDMAPILNRAEWKTRVTGQADFKWTFSPAEIDFKFSGPNVEGFGYRAANVRAQGVYQVPRLADGRPGQTVLRFDASGAAYGANATTRATFNFSTPSKPLSYRLEGAFRNLDMRRLPGKLSMPPLETQAAGNYSFEAQGRNWTGKATLNESVVEGARFDSGTVLGIESRDRELSYSASGNVAWLNPRRFAAPLEIGWLDDDRLDGSLTGAFTFTGSGRTVDDLVLNTTATLVDSTLAGARFPSSAVDFQMAARKIHAKFTGPFEELPGSLLTERKELAGTTLNGSADMAVALTVPKVGPTELLDLAGTATLEKSTIAGMPIDSGQAAGSFANQTVDIKELVLSGPDVKASAAGTLALGETGESKLSYDVAVTNLEPLAKRFDQPFAGSAQIVGEASGPAANLTLAGKLGANRIRYGTNVDALTANSTYTAHLPNFDIEQGKVQAETTATFVTLAGQSFPRLTAKTDYEKNELQFDTTVEEERRSLGLGGRVCVSSRPRRAAFAGAQPRGGPDAVDAASRTGSHREVLARLGDAGEFRPAARRAGRLRGRHRRDWRLIGQSHEQSDAQARERPGAGHQ